VQRLGAARGLGDDVHALLLEQVAEPRTEEVVVVDEKDAERLSLGLSPWCGLVQRCLLG
jgi:hypothetical protein